jgi:hypothetical protein
MSLLTQTSERPCSVQANGQSPSLSHDLRAAQAVQQALFPGDLPGFAGWELATGWRPARVVAGDYHDLFALSPCRANAPGKTRRFFATEAVHYLKNHQCSSLESLKKP